MTELPQGTVTFLFTDIEGSTELLKRLGARYGDVLEAHGKILREAASSHGGREVDNQGDSFFFAFVRANAALGAAVVAQRALAARDWPDGVEVRVRMGLHTGEPAVGGERYVGMGVHRAARIGAAGHGGQVLLSNATCELVEEELDGVVVRELGDFRLKDIDRPERLFQLDIDGLPSHFPPLRAERVVAPRPVMRRPLLVGALAGVVAAAVAIPVFALGGSGGKTGSTPSAATSNSLAVFDPHSGRLLADPGVGATPTQVAAGAGAYWVVNADGDSVSKIDPATNSVVDTITNVGSGPSGIAIGNDDVWVANSLGGDVARIDAKTDTVVQRIPVGNGPAGIAYAGGFVWVANTSDGTITRIDAASGRPEKHPLPVAATELTTGGGALWATQRAASHVVRIDPGSGSVAASIQVGNGPTGVVFGDRSVWVANSLDGTVSRIDPDTNSVTATIATGDTPTGLALDEHGGVWVANEYGGTLRRIDPSTNVPGDPVDVRHQLRGLASAGSALLASVDARPGAGHSGGTLKVALNFALDSIDTAVAYSTSSWPIVHLTNDGLVGFDHASGLAGDQLVPDLAVSLPTPTEGGRAYTFQLRPDLRYSTGEPVRASDVRASFERFYETGAVPVTYYDELLGGSACRRAPKSCDLSTGIVTDDRAGTVTFHLVAADPEFLYKLALPFASVLPAGTPAKLPASRPLPATGPYVISSYRPGSRLTLVRNRYFHQWSEAAQPDGYPARIEFAITPKRGADSLIREVTSGRSDLVSTLWTNSPSSSGLQAATSRYASQVHSNPQPASQGLFLNTRLAPFDRPAARRALNFAFDRAAAVEGDGVPAPRSSDLPGPASRLPRLPAVLPLHGRWSEGGEMERSGPRHGAPTRRSFRDARYEDHGVGGQLHRGRRAERREAAPVARLSQLDQGRAERQGLHLLRRGRRLAEQGPDRHLGLGGRLPGRLGLLRPVHVRGVRAEQPGQRQLCGVLRPRDRPAGHASPVPGGQ